MKHSNDRILTTHVGSLPRPEALLVALQSQLDDANFDQALLDRLAGEAVGEIVAMQLEAGIDVVSDGEMSKISYTHYVKNRLDGVGARGEASGQVAGAAANRDFLDHPDFLEMQKIAPSRSIGALGRQFNTGPALPACIGPISYGNRAPVERDIEQFQAALAAANPVEAFINAASPGVLTKFVPDMHYGNEDRYVADLADAMGEEYEAIHDAGFLLQIDCPDLCSARHNQYQDLSEAEFLKIAERNVEALNHATRNIPPEDMRMHICWGNYEGPHTHDLPLASILPLCIKARPQALLFEGANPRHEHEWADLEGAGLPDDMILIPGVIDSTTNFVEHPRLIEQRIGRYTNIVGRERVIAGADCGFSTFAGPVLRIAPSVTWAKFRALAEGAALATGRLWAG
jgi:5-methyltetrahydropteroyltriglutamate--homocysteine methyltransferase